MLHSILFAFAGTFLLSVFIEPVITNYNEDEGPFWMVEVYGATNLTLFSLAACAGLLGVLAGFDQGAWVGVVLALIVCRSIANLDTKAEPASVWTEDNIADEHPWRGNGMA